MTDIKASHHSISNEEVNWATIKIPRVTHRLKCSDGLIINFNEDQKIPNAFHRFMQNVAFGFEWEIDNDR